MRLSPVRGLLVSLLVVGLVLAVIAALTGLLLVVALVVGLTVLNVVYLRRLAVWLRLPVAWLVVVLIPVMVLVGFVLGGVAGGLWGLGIWAAAIGLPRAVGRDVVRRTQRRIEARFPYYDVPARRTTGTEATTPTGGRGERPLPPEGDRGRGEYGP